jgi:cytochrome b subunit of formate dehydrogenase
MKKIGTIEGEYVIRFDLHMRLQHIILFISMILLGLSGFALKYSHTFIGKFLVIIEGGIEGRGYLHRIAAILLIFDVFYHLWYIIFTEDGNREFRLLIPRWKDLRDFFYVLYGFFAKKEYRIEFDKYTYKEKFQYWGVVFGTAAMIFTGLIMWFETFSMMLIPKWLFDICIVLHGSGALVLFILLFLWHIYITHFSPENFPINMEWWHGKRKLEDLKEKRILEYRRYVEGKR